MHKFRGRLARPGDLKDPNRFGDVKRQLSLHLLQQRSSRKGCLASIGFDSNPLGFRAFLAPIDRGKTLCELFKRRWSRIRSTPFF